VGTPTQKTINTASTTNQPPNDPKVDNNRKGTTEDENNKEILANPIDPKTKLKIGPQLDPK
jgi:hypothetical protein